MKPTGCDYTLDISGFVCPMTFVRTALFLEKMAPGETVAVRLKAGEAHRNVPRAARDQGHEVVGDDEEPGSDGAIHIVVLRAGPG